MSEIKLHDIQLTEIPKITDEQGRGSLSVVEGNLIPFDIRRAYYLYDVPSDASRGGHAHRALQQFLIALSGSFDVVLDDGEDRRRFILNRPYQGLLIPSGIWRELENFSAGAVCLSLVSAEYDEADYIRDYSKFRSFKGR